VKQAPQQHAVEQKAATPSNLAASIQSQKTASAPTSTKGSLRDLASALGTATATQKAKPGVATVKIKRNSPCPCGSGKKYKKCGLINAPEHKG